MKKLFFLMLLLCFIIRSGVSQQYHFPKRSINDSVALATDMSQLAEQILKDQNAIVELPANDLFRLQMLTGNYKNALATIEKLRNNSKEKRVVPLYRQFELYAVAKQEKKEFYTAFSDVLKKEIQGSDDSYVLNMPPLFISRNGATGYRRELEELWTDTLSLKAAVSLCKSYFLYEFFRQTEPISVRLLKEEDARRYIISDSVMIKTPEGFTISAVVVRKREIITPQPAALMFFMYANTEQSLYEAKQSAAHGYVGVVADVRGKRLSPDAVAPYENEVKDVNAVIDWISKQAWSNGKVGMYGGSYSGFAQWAATKNMHPALKTIVPYVAAIPGLGLPMENNIFINPNYGWTFYVTNNKYLDNEVYSDPERWNRMQENWYTSGAAYNKIDSIDGTANPWLQKWLQHPSFDAYWQRMIPYKQDYGKINIPVLSITGYYDDGQISAIHYLKEHYKYNPQANHYLIIGPYDHFGAQQGGSAVLRGYKVDSSALINTRGITYQWLDYVMKGGQKPALLKDKINYQVMGANVWKHAPSLKELNDKNIRLYLTDAPTEAGFKLSRIKPENSGFLHQEVDFKDRTTSNNEYYPYPIIKDELDRSNGLFFVSDSLTEDAIISGTFSGELKVRINKKDMDIGIALYEVLPDGKFFCLSYYLGRASYAADMSKRKLLKPGKKETIAFERTRMVSRKLNKGSRILVVVNINKNSGAQVNYGTGKDVSRETIADAKEPLKIQWLSDSFISLPMETYQGK